MKFRTSGLLILAIASCGGEGGRVRRRVQEPVATIPPSKPWERWAEVDAMDIVAENLASAHGPGGWSAEVRRADGAWVALHEERGAPRDIFVMMGEPGRWEFAVLSPTDGSVLARGALPLCARCHAEADGGVFPLPR